MTRSLSSIVTTAIADEVTKPIYLVRMDWETERRVATWDTDIVWNSETWTASGVSVDAIDLNGGILNLPQDEGAESLWLSLVTTEIARDRAIEVYEYHTSVGSPLGSDAELLFVGIMDEAVITHRGIRVSLIESRINKFFPPTSIQEPTYNYLLAVGSRIFWGPDIVTVN